GILWDDGSLKRNVETNKGSLFRVEFIIMQFPYVDICAILSDDRINDGAVKPLITKEAQERDMVDPGRLKEAAAFERIRLLRFLYFCDSEVSGSGIRMDDLKGFPDKSPIREGDRHPCKIGADIEADREVRRTAVNPCK
ncbi:hypothetical protein PZH32_11460, partial [Adlercreutzia equolifaciens]